MLVRVQLQPDGKYVVKLDDKIDVNKLTTGQNTKTPTACRFLNRLMFMFTLAGTRVALRNDSYHLHKILPTKVF